MDPANNQTSSTKTRRVIRVITLVFIFLTALLWALCIITKSESTSDYFVGTKLGGAVAVSTWIALAIYLICRFVIRRCRKYGLAPFFVVLFCASIFQTLSVYRNGQSTQAISEATAAILTATLTGRELSQGQFDSLAVGESRPLVEFMQSYVEGTRRNFQNYFRWIDSSGISAMLAPKTLSSQEKIAEARFQLRKADSVIDHYDELMTSSLSKSPGQLSNIPASRLLSREFMRGFESGVEKSKASIAEFFNIERRFVAKLDEMLSFMQEVADGYHFENGQLYFERSEHADKYNAIMTALNSIAKEEEQSGSKARSRAQSLIDSLKRP